MMNKMEPLSARDRAIMMLNHRKPQHPPDIYFIRRNPLLLSKYKDPNNFEQLRNDAPTINKHTYELFDLNEEVQPTILGSDSKKRVLMNNDPYF